MTEDVRNPVDLAASGAGYDDLRAALETAQRELVDARAAQDALARESERLRKQAMTFEARRAKETQVHEDALARLRAHADRDVIQAEARAEAVRLGAHNPDDVLRLVDLSEVSRGEDGAVAGIGPLMEKARSERGYLFSTDRPAGLAGGNAVSPAAPKPGEGREFDARGASTADYEARKWQFLRGGS